MRGNHQQSTDQLSKPNRRQRAQGYQLSVSNLMAGIQRLLIAVVKLLPKRSNNPQKLNTSMTHAMRKGGQSTTLQIKVACVPRLKNRPSGLVTTIAFTRLNAKIALSQNRPTRNARK